MRSRFLAVVFVLGCVFFLLPSSAFAYIDPGSGNYIVQVLVAAFAGLVYTLGHWWRNIIGFLRRLCGKKDKSV